MWTYCTVPCSVMYCIWKNKSKKEWHMANKPLYSKEFEDFKGKGNQWWIWERDKTGAMAWVYMAFCQAPKPNAWRTPLKISLGKKRWPPALLRLHHPQAGIHASVNTQELLQRIVGQSWAIRSVELRCFYFLWCSVGVCQTEKRIC